MEITKMQKSFFVEERKKIKWITNISLAIISLFIIYFLLVLTLPFMGVRDLIKNIPYFGWPLISVLMLLVWVPALFISFGAKRIVHFTDYQLILEQKTIARYAILLALPSCFVSLLLFTAKKFIHDSKDFRTFNEKNNQSTQIWLSDKRPMKASESAALGLSWIVVLFWLLIIIYPIYQLVKTTFNSNLFMKLGPSEQFTFSTKHFTRLFKNYKYWQWMSNTLFIAVITMIIVVIVSSFAAYVYSRNRFKSKKASLLLVMTLGLIPAAAALAAYYVLSVVMDRGLGMNARWLLIFIYSGGGAVGNIFILKGYLDNISTEIDDAARVDGLSKVKVFWKVILPLMKPMLAISAIGAFVGPFGDFILPGILFVEPSDFTLAQGLQGLASGQGSDETAFAAGAIIIAVPITIIVMVSQTMLTKGSTAGGVKG